MSDPLASLMAGAKSGPETTSADADEVDAAQDLIDAIKAGDAKAASLALSRHYELCESKEGDEGGDEDEEEAPTYAREG